MTADSRELVPKAWVKGSDTSGSRPSWPWLRSPSLTLSSTK